MARGTKTSVRGIARIGKQMYRVRVVVNHPRSGQRKERVQQVVGSMQEAVEAKRRIREELLAEIEAEVEEQRIRPRARMAETPTLSAYAKQWLAHVERTGRAREHVIERNINALEVFVLPFLGELRLDEVGGMELGVWMERLGGLRKEDGKPYATETLSTAWGVLRTALRDAVVLCGLPQDPTSGVRFRVKGTPPKERTVLDAGEVSRVLAAAEAEAPDIRLMLWIGFATGMRFGEVSALTWDDVDTQRRVIIVRRSQVHGKVGPTKTGRARRVPLDPIVAGMLEEHRAWQETRKVRGLERGIVFPSQKGTYRFPAVLTKPLKRCCERAEIGKVASPHDMRRTFNNILRQSAGEVVTRSIVGHTTVAMTALYSSVGLAEQQAAQQAALGDALIAAKESGTGEWDLGGTRPNRAR